MNAALETMASDGTVTGQAAPRKLRVLFYNHTSHVSGAERVLIQMLDALAIDGRFEVSVACPATSPGEAGEHLVGLQEVVRRAGYDVVPVTPLQARFTRDLLLLAGYLRSFTGAILSFRRMVRAAKPDVLHANSVRAGIVATIATLGTGLPIVWHVQDDLPRHVLSVAIRRLAWETPRVHALAVSQATARAFASDLPFEAAKRMSVLYNGIDLQRFPPRDEFAFESGIREELGLTRSERLIVFVGMMNPRKGLTELIEAFALAAEQLAGTHLVLVGTAIFNRDDLYLEALQRRAAELMTDPAVEGRIHFVGARNDVPAVLRAADLLVLNAKLEPFGLVLVEAMASGAPVLAAAVGGIPEIVTDGVTGFLIQRTEGATDTRELAARMVEVFSRPEEMERIAAAARAEVCPRFSLDAFRANLLAFYERHFLFLQRAAQAPMRSDAAH